MADEIGSAEFILRATRDKLKQDLKDAERDLKNFTDGAEQDLGGSTGRMGGMIGKIGLAVTAVAAAIGAGIALAIRFGGASLEMAETLADSAKRIGMSTTALQEWQYVARKTGEDAFAVSGALDTFATKFEQAAAGLSKDSLNAFKALGFDQSDLRQFKSVEEALDHVTDRIGELDTAADRSAIAEKLGLGPLATALGMSADEVVRLRDEASALGFVMDEDIIRKGAEAQAQLEDLSQIIGIQMAEAFIGLSDEVIAFTGHVANALKVLNDFVEGWGQFNTMNGSNGIGNIGNAGANFGYTSGLWDRLPWKSDDAARMRAGETWAGDNSDDPALLRQQMAVDASNDRPRAPRSGRTGLTPVQPRGRTDNSAERAAEREARRAERVEAEINRARTRLLGIADEEVMTVQQRHDAEKRQVEAERAAEATQLLSRKARKDITGEELMQLSLINAQTAALEDRVANDILARDLADERLANERALSDLTIELLGLQSGAARTAKERREIELRLLAISQQQAREDLETALSREPGRNGAAERAALQSVQQAQTAAVNRGSMSPLEQWRDQALQSAGEVEEALESVASSGLDALNQGIVDAIMGTRDLGDVFSQVAAQIIADLAAIAIRRSITEPLANMLFPSGGGLLNMVGSLMGFSGMAGAGDTLGNLTKGVRSTVSGGGALGPSGGMSSPAMVRVAFDEGSMFKPRIIEIAGPVAVETSTQGVKASRTIVPGEATRRARFTLGQKPS